MAAAYEGTYWLNGMASKTNILTTAEFEADFPDDLIEEGGTIVRISGLNIAEAIASLLRQERFDVSEPDLDGDNGWAFFAKSGGRKFWVLVTAIGGPCLLQTEDVSSIATILFSSGRKFYADFLSRLHSVLLKDQRFHSVRWYPKEWYKHGVVGAKSPFGDS